MKRYIMILVLVCMMISLSACGNSNRTGKNDIMVNQNIILWKVKSKLVCNFPRSSVNPLTHPHVNIRVTITVKIPNV
jgi:predicted small secreted protein